MKASDVVRIVSGALVLLTALNTYAQNGDATTNAVSAPTAASVKAANRALQKSVRRALAKARGLSVANITVRARDGAVLLQGSVTTQAQIDLATRVAQSIGGVTSVKNDLTVSADGQ